MQKYQARLSGLLFVILFMQGSVSATVSFPWVSQSRHDEKECNEVMKKLQEDNDEVRLRHDNLVANYKALQALLQKERGEKAAVQEKAEAESAKKAKIKWFCIGAAAGAAGAAAGAFLAGISTLSRRSS